MKPLAPGIDQYIDLVEFVRFQMFSFDELLRNFFRLEELMPAANNVFGRCAIGAVTVNMQYNVVVIRKDSERSYINIKKDASLNRSCSI